MSPRVPLIALAALLLCASMACQRSNNPAHVSTVDSLLLTTDSLIKGMHALDMAAISAIDSAFALKKDALNARMRDTLSKEEAMLLGNYYRAMVKTLGRVKSDHGKVLTELMTSQKQLTDLHNDVEKGLLEPGAETKYISDEQLALARNRQSADIVASSVQSVIRDQARYGPLVDSLLVRTDTIPAHR